VKVLLIRPNRNQSDAREFEALGFEALIDPYLEISRVENPKGALRMLEALRSKNSKWFVNSSVNGFEYFLAQLPEGSMQALDQSAIRFAAIGQATRQQLLDQGIKKVLLAPETTGLSLAEKMLEIEKAPVVIPAGTIAMRQIPDKFSKAGLEVISEVVYETKFVDTAPESVALVTSGDIVAVVFRSPSAVRAFLHFNENPEIKFVCLGPTTAGQLESLGFRADVIAADGDVENAALALRELIGKK
jgi:uroporphyrinogen-III synthase